MKQILFQDNIKNVNNVITCETKTHYFEFFIYDERPCVYVYKKCKGCFYSNYSNSQHLHFIAEFWDCWERCDIIDNPEVEYTIDSLMGLWLGY